MKYLIAFISLTLSFHSYSQDDVPMTKYDSLSYSIGVVVAQNLKSQGFNRVNHFVMSKAIADVLQSEDLLINGDVADAYFRNELSNIKIKEKEMNKQAGEEFLAENAKKAGVVTTASGLQYEVLTEGTGESPVATDKVRVFDSSVERGDPISFGLGQVIQAWQEAVPLMKVGGKNRVYCPYDLAYGDRGAGPLIGPYSALIFEIELLGIE